MEKDQKIKNLLEKLGLTGSEINVYMYLLERGVSMSVMDIAKGLVAHRPIIYKALSLLLEKSLISSTLKGKRKQYQAESPEKLRNMANEVIIDVEETIPDLEDMYKSPKTKPIVKFLEGKKGITYVFADLVDSLKKGDVYYRYSSSKNIDSTNSYLPKDYRKKRDNKHLERYIIHSQYVELQKKPNLNRNTKVVPPEFDLFDQNIIQLVYGNKVAIVDINTETSFIIENDKFADFQKKIFKLLYSKL
jgi:sugar-specific transcriptional regulator TrmB